MWSSLIYLKKFNDQYKWWQVNQTKDPNTKKLERDLSEALGAEVAIKHNKKGKGVLSISFENLDALDGLLAKIKSKKS